jgi:hypothetical protein
VGTNLRWVTLGGVFHLVLELNYLKKSFLAWGPEFKTILKIPGFWFFFKSIVPAESVARYNSRQISFLKWRVANLLTGF